MRIEAIYISPVKSLALLPVDRVHLRKTGIAEDRRFFLADERGRVFTQRECGALTQIKAAYALEPESLRLEFPDGSVIEDAPVRGAEVATNFFGHDVPGFAISGPWNEALSAFAGTKLGLIAAAKTAFDVLPVSILSSASVDELRAQSGEAKINERRFRPNFYISGVDAHGEDAWIGQDVRLGAEATVRVVMRDSRCEMTTHDPATGEIDMNTLKMIAAYRTDQPKEVNFGVYGGVVREGEIAVGDQLMPLGAPAAPG